MAWLVWTVTGSAVPPQPGDHGQMQVQKNKIKIQKHGRCLGLCLVLLAYSSGTHAQTLPSPEPESAVGDLLLKFKIRHGPVTPKDFVVNSRQSAPRHDFMPVGVTPPDHEMKVKSQDEILATTASLDALRARHGRPAGSRWHNTKKPVKPKTPAPAGPNPASGLKTLQIPAY